MKNALPRVCAQWHEAGGASPLGVACAAWLEQLAVIYANCGAFPKSILFSICILCVLWHIVKSKGASVRMVTLYDVLYMLSMAYCDESRF